VDKSPQNLPLTLGAGLAGAAIVSVCVCTSAYLLLSGIGWEGVDPALLDALALPVLAVGLAVVALTSLANGVIWSILIWKQGKRALPWMLVSLCCALVVPYALPVALIFLGSGPQLGDVLCICGAPSAIVGAFALAFRLSMPGQKAVPPAEPESQPGADTGPAAPAGEGEVQALESEQPTSSGGCLAGLVTFSLGLGGSILTAGVCVLLLGLVTFLLLDAQALVPSSGTPKDVPDLLAAAYPLLSPVVVGIASLIASLVLTLIVVVPRIPTRAGKVFNTILFTLLSGILGLLFGFAVVARLYNDFHPGHWW
jgi:hypothetical protein